MVSDHPVAIANVTRGTRLADAARAAHGPWQRFVGLMGRAALPLGGGLVFAPCRGLHTWFMRFPIDLVYVRRDNGEGLHGTVVRLCPALRPFRIAPERSDLAVELPAGTIARTGTAVGDRIALQPAAAQPRIEG